MNDYRQREEQQTKTNNRLSGYLQISDLTSLIRQISLAHNYESFQKLSCALDSDMSEAGAAKFIPLNPIARL